MERFTVSLQEIELYAFHGLYPAEKELGAKYLVNIDFSLVVDTKKHLDLHDTVDYKKAYDIVKEEFKTPTPLLENLCKRIAHQLSLEFKMASSISISISKLTPPLGGICKAAKVSLTIDHLK
jgi:7,8-dihydroneopterin aldolase/epimerase/oxygenase